MSLRNREPLIQTDLFKWHIQYKGSNLCIRFTNNYVGIWVSGLWK